MPGVTALVLDLKMLRSRKRPRAGVDDHPQKEGGANGDISRTLCKRKCHMCNWRSVPKCALVAGVAVAVLTFGSDLLLIKTSNIDNYIVRILHGNFGPAEQNLRQSSRHQQYVYGTPEHRKQCGWTYQSTNNNCTFLVRPLASSGEGWAMYVSNVALGFIYSVQAGCNFVTDYGRSVDINQVWSPPHHSQSERKSWSIQPGSSCIRKINVWTLPARTQPISNQSSALYWGKQSRFYQHLTTGWRINETKMFQIR